MNYKVLLLGLLVDRVNYCFRYLPPRLGVSNIRSTKRGATGMPFDIIGTVSVCALLMASTAPEVMYDVRRFVPMLVGFVILGVSFHRACGIIIPALLNALSYGLAWEMLVGLQIKTIILKK